MQISGLDMYQWAGDLFPICRSLTGPGVRQTLTYLQKLLPGLTIHEVASGTNVFDWTIPEEWAIEDAFVADDQGRRIIDFRISNLHVVGYSEPVNAELSYDELAPHLYSLPDHPDAIPYVTSYYKKRWGFCISENQRKILQSYGTHKFHVCIQSKLASGHLTYGELIIPGSSTEEVLLSTYICHPSMANNEISGPVVVAALARWLSSLDRRLTYRIVFVPETIGAITYLHKNIKIMRTRTIAGFVVTCVGDDRGYSYIPSPDGDTLADTIALHVLRHKAPGFKAYSFLDRGSDERQYCAPGVDLPVCSICRTKYAEYPEYHTSLDNMDLISPQGLQGAFDIYRACIELLEMNLTYKATTLGEPQLGKRGLYPTLSDKNNMACPMILNVFAYMNGQRDIIAIADRLGVYAGDLAESVRALHQSGLIKLVTKK